MADAPTKRSVWSIARRAASRCEVAFSTSAWICCSASGVGARLVLAAEWIVGRPGIHTFEDVIDETLNPDS